MKLDMNNHYRNVVRIISHEVGFDWLLPFQKSNQSKSFGSGFFIDTEGHILTCSHCVEDAATVYVEIPSEGNKLYNVEIKGVCPFFDLAILKIIDYKNESYIELDGETEIHPGSETFALGYPLGQENLKITKGIISGQQYNFYQTDTPINPGNSGGPLLYNNKVIAINAAGMPAHEAEGIGYSVPIKRFYSIKKQLFKKHNIIHYPEYFGFEQMQNTTPELQKYLKSECKSGGVYVNAIIPKSPVSKTKLRKGDIICRINDIKIDFSGDLNKKWMNENMSFQNLLAEIGINNLVKIEYWNGTKMVYETFKLNSFVTTVRTWYPVIEKIDYECFGGLIIMNVNKNVLEHIPNFRLLHLLDISNIMNESVIITNILVGGQVSKMDILSKGDIICKVNDEKIKTLSDFRKHFMKYKTYVKIETTKNKMVILPMKMLLQDDKSLIKTYNYKQSNVFKKVK